MDVIQLAPSGIRYSQDSISDTFRDGTDHTNQFIGETLDEIVSDPAFADLIPNIYVINKDGKWFTLDNRRLWVFKKAEKLRLLSSINVNVTHEIDDSKFTTTCDGKYVQLRGKNFGGYLWKALEKKIQKHDREQNQRVKKQRKKEKEQQRREMEIQMEKEQEEKMNKFIAVFVLILDFILRILGIEDDHNN